MSYMSLLRLLPPPNVFGWQWWGYQTRRGPFLAYLPSYLKVHFRQLMSA